MQSNGTNVLAGVETVFSLENECTKLLINSKAATGILSIIYMITGRGENDE